MSSAKDRFRIYLLGDDRPSATDVAAQLRVRGVTVVEVLGQEELEALQDQVRVHLLLEDVLQDVVKK